MSLFNFDELRAKRNAQVEERRKKIEAEYGISAYTTFNPNACYCACGTGGPCEHKWDGPDWESEDGCAMSVTCSRCGITAMSHDMRYAP